MATEHVQDIEKSNSSVPNHFQPHHTFNPPNIFSYLASEDDDLRLRASEAYAKVIQSSKEHPYLNINRISSEMYNSSLQPPKELSNFSELGSSRSQFNQIQETPIIYHPSINQKISQWQTNLSKSDLNPNIPSPGREMRCKEYSA
ncbi:uncharacterized protein MELLADRAFT_104438 [Melampsora larici-populina 98AG31]|uniref:Uncharacterized protein n=1 Tax=Melampsora larici-populina (strain 98AG31 / pathotype 3-4-7) TaxID=747676 RepID=F4REP6_MELLP|nr:uncharacterized protein MELLADRAFT_104438 [Melampsora larici-populina 98AG31]EGG09243.1 hypothetical protein MELLADRAFT_104438 [Melampsora larici-populina 98AG31]